MVGVQLILERRLLRAEVAYYKYAQSAAAANRSWPVLIHLSILPVLLILQLSLMIGSMLRSFLGRLVFMLVKTISPFQEFEEY